MRTPLTGALEFRAPRRLNERTILETDSFMDVFDFRNRLVEDYGRYTRSFIKIADPRVKAKVDGALDDGALWPEPLLQLNPTYWVSP
jgi:hypothetical protein